MKLNEMFEQLAAAQPGDVVENGTNFGPNAETVVETVNPKNAERIERENARRAKYGKSKMTAEEARRFEHFSANNAAALEAECEECTAYEDWFTFNRWIAQGKVVQKGQHGTKITVYIPKEEKLRDGSKKKVLVPKAVTCFCRHQVKTLEAKRAA